MTSMSLSMLLFVGPALAQEEPDPAREAYAAVTKVEFLEDVSVEGRLEGPSGAGVFEAVRGKFAPLIRLRSDFDAELDATVDEVD